jgi:hypothetical protein
MQKYCVGPIDSAMALHSPKALKISISGGQQIFTPQFAVEAVNNQDEVGLDR